MSVASAASSTNSASGERRNKKVRGAMRGEHFRGVGGLHPTPHKNVGKDRQKARTNWNVKEIELMAALGNRRDQITEGEFREILADHAGEEPTDKEFCHMMRLADRDKDGLIELKDLQAAMLSWHGYRSLRRDAYRAFAEFDMSEDDNGICAPALHALLEDLNGVDEEGNNNCVRTEERDRVVSQAKALGDGEVGRMELLRAIGAWYVYVERMKTDWWSLFYAGVRCYLWVPEQEYHTEVLTQLAIVSQRVATSLQARHRRDADLLHQERRDATGDFAHVMQVAGASMVSAFFLAALIFPTLFFASLIYVGVSHGDNRCPQDLDDLLVWFGVLGLARSAVGCADSGLSQLSYMMMFLTVAKLIIPWVGMLWSSRIDHAERGLCGPYLYSVSYWLWHALVAAELVVLSLVSWGCRKMYVFEKRAMSRPEQTSSSSSWRSRGSERGGGGGGGGAGSGGGSERLV